MSTPRAWPAVPTPIATEATAVLDSPTAERTDGLHEAELHRTIESVASRLLGFALERGAEELDPGE